MSDRSIRRAVVRRSHLWFFSIYFSHYMQYPTAQFQKEIFALSEDESAGMLVLVAFRGSAKSTIMSMSYPLWAILGDQGKKFVLLLSQTQRQAQQLLKNIKEELERNALLAADLGPFREETDEWGSTALVFSRLQARITAASTEQSIRGVRHMQHRPDLIICDDVEDIASTRTYESRQKTYQWLTGEVIPAGDRHTRLIIIGNLLHHDSLVMRIKKSIEQGLLDGTYREYPLLDANQKCLWPGKYPNAEAIEAEKKKTGDTRTWMREYLLTIVPDEDQVVHHEWIHRYVTMPRLNDPTYLYSVAAVDLAISQKESADCMAIVMASVFRDGDDSKAYVHAYPINQRLGFIQQQEAVKKVEKSLEFGRKPVILIEAISYQLSLVEQLVREGIHTIPITHLAGDKRTRLSFITPHIQSGKILFPQKGADVLLQQLLGFGAERHDDLVDALVMVINYCIQNPGRGVSLTEVMRVMQEANEEWLNGDNPCRPITAGIWNKQF